MRFFDGCSVIKDGAFSYLIPPVVPRRGINSGLDMHYKAIGLQSEVFIFIMNLDFS
jgi:hypothetical protein